jgi:hypothetical protein
MRRSCNHIKVNCAFGIPKYSVCCQSCSHQALWIKTQVLWFMTACHILESYSRLGGTFCPHLQSINSPPEDSASQTLKMGATSYFEILVSFHWVSRQRKLVHITDSFRTRTDERRIEFLYTQCGADRVLGHSRVNLLDVYKIGFACLRIRVTAQPISHALSLK